MKLPLRLTLAALSALMLQQQSNAQVTLISNNTNISSGLVLPGSNRPVLLDDNGGLWTTNGTTATKITTTVTHPDTTSAAVYNNLMYFAGADAANDVELWVTDGTAGGTKLIKDITSGASSVPDDFFVFNNTLYFTADDGTHGRELWKSNGAVGNATLVADINSGSADAFDGGVSFYQNGNNIYFGATSGANNGLYKIDLSGTPTLVKNIDGDIAVSILECASLGSNTVFTVRTGDPFTTGTAQLWVTDGTAAGTKMLKDFGFGSYYMFPQLVPYNGVLFFDGYDVLGSGVELWTTDGTAANTKLFKDIFPGAGNSSTPLLIGSALINGKMFFSATSGTNGNELWITDGTAAGTTLFKDINTTSNGKGDASPIFLANIGAYINLTDNSINNFNFQQAYSTEYNGKWYFIADDGTHGVELWATNGTSGGTQIVKDINPGSPDGLEYDNIAFYTTNGIYFTADNGSTGTEPFVTDGTATGTNPVADINTKSKVGSDPAYMFLFNSQIYLNADNGDNTDGNTDLYKIDQSVVVLPVNLLTFNVALRDGNVALNWTTGSEVNTKNFVVERSTDGVHFSALGTLAAAGNSNTAHQYQYSDASALQAGASTLYYRLRVVDNDGRYSYTAILPVQLQGGMFKITLSPNPVHDQLTVTFSANNAKNITLRVTDANGKPVYQQQFQTNGVVAMQQNINVARYAAGAYFVQLITDKSTKTASFVKQ